MLHGDVPRYPGVNYDGDWGVWHFQGQRLPRGLVRFAAPAHSWERYVQDIFNGRQPLAPPERPRPPLRDYQRPGVQAMHTARAQGAPGFLLVFPTGSGKTAMGISAVTDPSVRTVLVITKHGVIPPWRRAVDFFGSRSQRWVVINAERLHKLFRHPHRRLAALPAVEGARIAATSDLTQSRAEWDAVIVDESHILADPLSIRSRLVYRLLNPHPRTGEKQRPFSLWMSATPFSTLEETAYCSALIAHAAGVPEPAWLPGPAYREWLARTGVTTVEQVKALLYDRGLGMTSTPAEIGLPDQDREVRPLSLSAQDRERYERTWEEFLQLHDLAPEKEDEPGSDARIAALRQVQKASLLKSPHVARLVADLVGEGHQVIVPAWFRDTVRSLAVHIARELRRRGLCDRVLEITGEAPGLRELKRQAFQVGIAKVVVLNTLEGMNLHAGEANVDGKGTVATDTPRVTVIADVITGGKRLLQGEGRGQRNGRRARALYAFAAGTTEEAWLARTLLAMARTQELARNPSDAAALVAFAEQLVSADREGPAEDGAA
ncbi:DEAD/DEAH box helicase family protein [Streptomyces scopuliridis]|uniref:DEAD/DEAH box helicase family protein n=1 Tax=Streptomyces scopuliridis TaxID=452529 RepID=A0ACD4ZTS5_9ACTN|nr:DEAD/DEAH box helicase family protein [Streptomyces scopuliridis]WSC01698.1 DEAD/DEAH box helicase family protein [Streptomyces scopuliridis]WSC04763.1 DEAD/DEAH box helicase family protein [Streptomyces scopuliridis]